MRTRSVNTLFAILAAILFLFAGISVVFAQSISTSFFNGFAEDAHEHPVCGEACPDESHDDIVWTAFGGSFSAGNYYLTEDVSLSANATVTGDVKLDLNGFKLNLNGKYISIGSNGIFTLTDCNFSNGKHFYTAAENQQWVFTTEETDTFVEGGVITGGSGSKSPVCISSGGVFNMYGGTVAGNNMTSNGGGVNLAGSKSAFNMYGGAICGNKTSGKGGGAYLSNGTVNLYGGSFTENVSTNSAGKGGGVYLYSVTASLCGAVVIRDNSAGNLFTNSVIAVKGALTDGDDKSDIYINSTKDIMTSDYGTYNAGVDADTYFTLESTNNVMAMTEAWEAALGFTVSFLRQGDVIATQKVLKNSYANAVTDVKSLSDNNGKHRRFGHWSQTEDGEEYVFESNKVSGNLTLYAVFESSYTDCTFGDWQTVTEPSCLGNGSKGLKKQVCDCGYEQTEAIEWAHDLNPVERKEADCYNVGNIAYGVCKVCTRLYNEEMTKITLPDTVIPAINHENKQSFEKETHCDAEGHEAYWYCPDCKKYFADKECTSEQEEEDLKIPATGHKSVSEVGANPADCTHDGNIKYWYCSDCKCYFSSEAASAENEIAYSDTVIGKLGHDTVMYTELAPSCTQQGRIQYWECSRCGCYTDKDCTQPIDKEKTVVKPLGHDMVEHTAEPATCLKDGTIHYWHCDVCKKDFLDKDGNTETKDTVDHDRRHSMNHHGPNKASCTQDGDIEYWYCNVCQKYFLDENGDKETTDLVDHAQGHKLVPHNANPSSCYKEGNIKYWQCSVCDTCFTEIVNFTEIAQDDTKIGPKGHSQNPKFTEKLDPKCKKEGCESYWTCPDCGDNFYDKECTQKIDSLADLAIEMLGHDFGEWIEEPSTCEEGGNGIKGHYHCNRCGKDFDEEENELEDLTLPLADHTPADEWILDEAPTTRKEGSKHKVCSVCGSTVETSSISKLAEAEDGVSSTDEDAGTVEKQDSVVDDGAPESTLNNGVNDLREGLLTVEDEQKIANGENVDIYLQVKPADATVTAAEKEEVAKVAEGTAVYVDLSVYKKIGAESAQKISESLIKLSITLAIPQNIYAEKRVYQVVRVHNGVAEALETELDGKAKSLTFETDKFSVYAIVYKDIVDEVSEEYAEGEYEFSLLPKPVVQEEKEGSDFTQTIGIVLICFAGVVILAVTACILIIYYRKKKADMEEEEE